MQQHEHNPRVDEIEAAIGELPDADFQTLRGRFTRTTLLSHLAASRVMTGLGHTSCRKTATWLLSSIDRTGTNGQVTISLNKRLCTPDVNRPALFGISPLVATAISAKPTVL